MSSKQNRGKYADPGDRLLEIATISGHPKEGTPSWLLLERSAAALANVCDRYGVAEVRVVTSTGTFDVRVSAFKREQEQIERWQSRTGQRKAKKQKEKNSPAAA